MKTQEVLLESSSKGKAKGSSIKEEEHNSSFKIPIKRYFTKDDVHPFDQVKWVKRTASITNEDGKVIFEQKEVESPEDWSQLSVNVVVSKYFNGTMDSLFREKSIKQLISRVSYTIADWALSLGYFDTEEEKEIFRDELTYIVLHQMAVFNSPVWFNVGIEKQPQCSACFINSVKDTMESILELAKTEGMLFKWGSGTGTNLSSIRSSYENLSSGGIASGPVSFMKGYDAFAGVIKSGGKTRRAAKMVILNIDHPDVEEFIECKAKEEKKAWALIEQGYDPSFNGEAYSSIFFQNGNNSVRVSDEFMNAVINDEIWQTKSITEKKPMQTYKARHLMKKICDSAHVCGDPGLQFDTTINDWHTSKNSGRINASNPCSEYMFLDDTACNLSSINLMKFLIRSGEFDYESFFHVVDIMTLSKEVIVDSASYPTQRIGENSNLYRTLGLGFANLGALLMASGFPYNSDEGRAYAGVITALMTGRAYRQSALISRRIGPFPQYKKNREPMLEVIYKHAQAVNDIDRVKIPITLYNQAAKVWEEAYELGKEFGYRNAQVSVIAPTGTIAFMMDCDTTGIEPDIALVKYKKLVGGGMLKIINNTVPKALAKLGYSDEEISDITKFIDENDTIEGAPHLKEEHLNVFDCAFKPMNGTRSIHYMGHVKMMAAVQPFVSGAISKTVNLPEDATAKDIEDVYIEAWQLGLKAIAIYRDGSKRSQPLNTGLKKGTAEWKPFRKKLPDERKSITHKFGIAGHEGYITVGLYEDDKPGEIFIKMSKEGSVISGLMDAFATAISLSLQYGVPLQVLVNKFSHMRFEPSGMTQNKDIPMAKSIMDYIFRWLALKFLSPEEYSMIASKTDNSLTSKSMTQDTKEKEDKPAPITVAVSKIEKPTENILLQAFQGQVDAEVCHICGSIMVRNGACYKCLNCGSTSGCS